MIVLAMLISGAVAGLVGLPILFGDAYTYGSTFQSGLGFAGIAIALLGRNHPIGIAIGALLFAFLDEQSNPLQILVGVSPDIVAITQGVIVLTVVISYELVRRYGVRLEQQKVARALAQPRARHARGGARHEHATDRATTAAPTAAPPVPHAPAPAAALLVPDRVLGLLAALSLLGIVTGANDLTSSGTLAATLVATVPIMLAGLGGLWSERAGVVNIGLEGMMILGTWGAGYFGYHYGPWAGVLGAIAMGVLGGLVHAVATVVFGVDHIISGVAINIIALGAVQYLADADLRGAAGRRPDAVAEDPDVPSLTIGPSTTRCSPRGEGPVPGLRARGAGRALVTNLSSLVVIALVLLPRWFCCGRRRSACGCAPAARARRRRSPSASTCCATSSSPCWSRAAWPAWPAASWPWSRRATTATARPVVAATSASPR